MKRMKCMVVVLGLLLSINPLSAKGSHSKESSLSKSRSKSGKNLPRLVKLILRKVCAIKSDLAEHRIEVCNKIEEH